MRDYLNRKTVVYWGRDFEGRRLLAFERPPQWLKRFCRLERIGQTIIWRLI